jgi:hypothetical protein
MHYDPVPIEIPAAWLLAGALVVAAILLAGVWSLIRNWRR